MGSWRDGIFTIELENHSATCSQQVSNSPWPRVIVRTSHERQWGGVDDGVGDSYLADCCGAGDSYSDWGWCWELGEDCCAIVVVDGLE